MSPNTERKKFANLAKLVSYEITVFVFCGSGAKLKKESFIFNNNTRFYAKHDIDFN